LKVIELEGEMWIAAFGFDVIDMHNSVGRSTLHADRTIGIEHSATQTLPFV
jgi:hypothetical protein